MNPYLAREQWPSPTLNDNKVHISIRLDAEVVAHFKQGGKKYQSEINRVLRRYVDNQKRATLGKPSTR